MLPVHDAKFVNGTMIGAKGIGWDDTVAVMQYTGLKDKNGREIYEGDVRCGKYYFQSEQQTSYQVMKWDEKNACFYWDGPEIPDFVGVEVIGNIYENPELLANTKS